MQVAGRSRGGSHVANMCNAVVLGAVRTSVAVALTGTRESSDVTVDTPAPASCMESLPGCGQNSGRVLSVSQKSRNEKCYLRELL